MTTHEFMPTQKTMYAVFLDEGTHDPDVQLIAGYDVQHLSDGGIDISLMIMTDKGEFKKLNAGQCFKIVSVNHE